MFLTAIKRYLYHKTTGTQITFAVEDEINIKDSFVQNFSLNRTTVSVLETSVDNSVKTVKTTNY